MWVSDFRRFETPVRGNLPRTGKQFNAKLASATIDTGVGIPDSDAGI